MAEIDDTPGRDAARATDGVPSRTGSRYRRGAARYAAVAGFVLLLAAVVFVVARRPQVSNEETRHVGRWYGAVVHASGNGGYAWLVDQQADHTLDLVIRTYLREVEPQGWSYRDSMEVGRWTCRDGVMREWRRDASSRLSWLARARWLFEHGHWPRLHPTVWEYDVTAIRADEVYYRARMGSDAYHAIRVPDDFVLPARPRTVEEVRRHGRGPQAKPRPAREIQAGEPVERGRNAP